MVSKDVTQLLTERVKRIKPSPTIAMSAKAESMQAEGKPVINLSIGEPDFDTPEHIKQAAVKALADGHTKYTAVDGILSLKQAICQKLKQDNGLHYELNQILVSSGAKHSIYNLLSVIIQAGDEVIIPAPYWVSYPDMVMLCDGIPVIVSANADQAFKISPDQLKAAITDKTRLIILNSPSNPSGMAYTREEWQAIGEVLLAYPDIMIVSDDIYERNLWNHTPFCNILNACPELVDRTVIVNGVSKTYAMTGFRIGYAAGPAGIIAAMKKAQSQNTSSPCSISQYAAAAALTGDQSCVSMMTNAYKERHDFVYAALKAIEGINVLPSDGTFYIFPNIETILANNSRGIKDDMQFAEYLLSEANLAIIPGSAFGSPGHIRICFTTSMEKLKIGMTNFAQAIEKLK